MPGQITARLGGSETVDRSQALGLGAGYMLPTRWHSRVNSIFIVVQGGIIRTMYLRDRGVGVGIWQGSLTLQCMADLSQLEPTGRPALTC